ncbi:OmpP1/FadL family transporter [Aliivibrio fischeri]|uniref:OmpP1/FadL family transporter n=1 Tax=Aliivibrio fischeri TaxID=668 RepID=UPI001F33E539|nr:outer membrane protein transport protein [Aliivibrio fischeri]MCE4936857.1 outer membrane protein transport protein [Aliivibrio fischeri]
MKTSYSLTFLSSVLLLAFQANAAGTLVQEMSKMTVSTAGAGSAALAENASVAYSNPAGMIYIEGDALSVNAAIMDLDIYYHDASDSSKDSDNAGGVQPYGSLYYVHQLNDEMHLGMSVSAQGGSALDYGASYAGARNLNDLRLSVIQFNPSISYQINQQLSIGAGLQIDYASFEETLLYGQGSLETDSWTLGYNLGLMYQLDEYNRFGISYRSRMNHDLTGSFNSNAMTVSVPIPGPIPGTVDKHIPAMSGQAGLNVLNPRQIEVSGLHQLTNPLSLVWSVGFEQWSDNDSTMISINNGNRISQIERNFDDVWSAALGARYQLTSRLRLESGIGYATSPLDSSEYQGADLPVDTQHRYSMGATYQWDKDISLTTYYSYVDYGEPEINNNGMNGQFDNANQFLGVTLNMMFK